MINKMKKVIKYVDEDTLELKEMIVEDEKENASDTDAIYDALYAALNCDSDVFFQKYMDYKNAESEWKKVYEPFKKNLIALHKDMPDMPRSVVIGGAKFTYVSPSTRNTIDSKKLKEEEPELAKKFTKTSEVAATIRVEDTF